MTILITGAAGFIASHVTEYYLMKGHTVVGIDNFDPYYPREYKSANLRNALASDRFHFRELDFLDTDQLAALFSAFSFDLVIHLGAKAGVRPSIEAAHEYYKVNVDGTLAILETMRKHGVRNMVFASSSSVYGNNPKVPFSEADSVDNPISPYASTKKSGELLCHVYTHLHGFNITCLRFFTVYGPRQRPDLAIHKFTIAIQEGTPIPVYGDGSTARDYTYIDDIVHGITCAAEKLNGYHLYNLGESNVVTLQEMITVIERVVGRKAVINRLPMQPGDVERTYADISKARKEIGYHPTTEFEAGVRNFVQWLNGFLPEVNSSMQKPETARVF